MSIHTLLLSEKEYADLKGRFCPKCRAAAPFILDEPLFSDGEITQRVICPRCKTQWQDVYALTRYALCLERAPEEG